MISRFLAVGLWTLGFGLQTAPAAQSATKANDIRLQQFDGLHWQWVELTPTNGSTLTFDESLQFKVDETADLLGANANITVSNITAKGYLSLSGLTNRLTVAGGELKLDGESITGGGGGDSLWLTNANGSISNVNTNSGNFTLGGTNNVASAPYSAALGVSAEADEDFEVVWNLDPLNVPQTGAGTNSFMLNAPGGVVILGSAGLAGNAALTITWELLRLTDGNSQVRFSGDANEPTYIADENGSTRIELTADENSAGSSIIYDANGEERFVAEQDGMGAGDLTLKDANADTQLTLNEDGVAVLGLGSGIITTTNGIGSLSTTAPVDIDETGWTNTFPVNAVVYLEGTGVTFEVYDNAGTGVYTNAATVTHATVILQPNGAVVIDGTGVSGRATPF